MKDQGPKPKTQKVEVERDRFLTWAERTPVIRERILKSIHRAGSGHPGSSLSLVEILYALLGEGGVMTHSPESIQGNDRDRLVLSKGHGVPALYAVLVDGGYGIDEDELMSLRKLGSRLQGHPDRARLPILEASTGSLGQGASIALGMAQGYRLDDNPHRIYAIVGDGEIQEGQIWEAALSAPHHKLGHLTLILDFNKGQIDGPVEEVLSLSPLREKWHSFGWHVHEVDGHSYEELVQALEDTHPEKPSFIIAHTIKGKGVDFMEGQIDWHGKAPNDEQLERALKEIRQNHTIGLAP
ncbi:MAG: transketolase [Bacteriovoracales bacterium]|nr:transketolase [Bacteriovoracales bacterium]